MKHEGKRKRKPLPCIGTATKTCGKPATWLRCTQFAGDHPLCNDCAAEDPTFASKNDPTGWHHTWRRIK